MTDLHAFVRWLARLPRDLARMALGRPPVQREFLVPSDVWIPMPQIAPLRYVSVEARVVIPERVMEITFSGSSPVPLVAHAMIDAPPPAGFVRPEDLAVFDRDTPALCLNYSLTSEGLVPIEVEYAPDMDTRGLIPVNGAALPEVFPDCLCPDCMGARGELRAPVASADVGSRGYVPEWAERKTR